VPLKLLAAAQRPGLRCRILQRHAHLKRSFRSTSTHHCTFYVHGAANHIQFQKILRHQHSEAPAPQSLAGGVLVSPHHRGVEKWDADGARCVMGGVGGLNNKQSVVKMLTKQHDNARTKTQPLAAEEASFDKIDSLGWRPSVAGPAARDFGGGGVGAAAAAASPPPATSLTRAASSSRSLASLYFDCPTDEGGDTFFLEEEDKEEQQQRGAASVGGDSTAASILPDEEWLDSSASPLLASLEDVLYHYKKVSSSAVRFGLVPQLLSQANCICFRRARKRAKTKADRDRNTHSVDCACPQGRPARSSPPRAL